MKLGLAGGITRLFIDSPLTPLLVLVSFALGAIALAALAREEEPQISVPMIDILVQADGLSAEDAVELVTKPLEDIIRGIDGVEHVYSQSEDDRVVVTARFYVGTDEDDAVLRVHENVRANYDRIPIGVPEPLIVGRGINDVPIVVLTLTPRKDADPRWDDNALFALAEELQHELGKIDNVGLSFIVGGRADQIRVEPDPEALSLYGVTLNQLVDKIRNANRAFRAIALRETGASLPVVAGHTLIGVPDIGLLLITAHDGRPVYVKDIADVVVGASPVEHRAWHIEPAAGQGLSVSPAVSLALAKREGANAVTIAEAVIERLALIQGQLVPDDVDVIVTRDYGETAADKSSELLMHLFSATVIIVIMIALTVGWREGAVVTLIIPATILLTFFASWLMGYTINRVSLFALIFSIGILVDDAIVVIENIVRHWREDPQADRLEIAIRAVDEVGNPTIVATLTIIAALLPMMFVSGLMGPYMSPIPANASVAMLFSFFVAVVAAPWLLVRLVSAGTGGEDGWTARQFDRLTGLYGGLARWLLAGRLRSLAFVIAVGTATLAALTLFYSKDVTVKLLPFDNKAEIQVVIDLPEGSALETTERVLLNAADRLDDLPELVHIQAYAGTAAPFNFNGLVRHYYLRSRPEQGDLQVNLLPKESRDRTSHEIALDIRARLAGLDAPEGTALKIAEVPPGPPVIATLLAEIYGPDAETRRAVARQVREAFEKVDFVVDVDDTFGAPADRLKLTIDQESLEYFGVEQEATFDTLHALLNGVPVGYSHRGGGANPIAIVVRLPKSELFPSERLMSVPVPAVRGRAELGDVIAVGRERASYPLFRRDGRFAEMVTAELAGRFEAPIYGMAAVAEVLERIDWGAAGAPEIRLAGQPESEFAPSLLWDGEWEITYVTFRDMGGAFAVALFAIYLLIVGQFRSFKLPLVIMVPIPLTLIGIVIGHWLIGAHFTATSMIGFIALAGIIVRNSILLVDFIRSERAKGGPLRAALLEAGRVRFKPILLTAVTAMAGSAFILFDPIFQGLAVSLLFGLASSTLLTLLVIPAIYVLLRDDGRGFSG